MVTRLVGALLALGLLGAEVLVAPPVRAAPALPSGFSDQLVAAVPAPTDFAFGPGGLVLIASQGGQVHALDAQGLRPVLDLATRVCSNFERGVLGVAVAPAAPDAVDFDLFVFFTARAGPDCAGRDEVNRVSRFAYRDGLVDPASEVVLLDGIRSFNGNHNAGDLAVGPDGLLYVTTGDGGCDYAGSGCAGANDAARDLHTLLGKVLRIGLDGQIPADNPYADGVRCRAGPVSAGLRCAETFASGFRNPFRVAFSPDGRLFVNDVGQDAWEEVDDVRAGGDYGWNACEGLHDNPSQPGATDCAAAPLTGPVHEYGHGGGCASITGGAFVPPGTWPASYDSAYLYADFVCGAIFMLVPGPAGLQRSTFADGLGGSSAVTLGFAGGADPALYYTTYREGGQLRRITPPAAENRPPTAVLAASQVAGAPLDVILDAGGSADPEGGPLTYEFDAGDGSALVVTDQAQVLHSYGEAGVVVASVVAQDRHGSRSPPATASVQVGPPPVSVAIEGPDNYAAGQRVRLNGRVDAAQGAPAVIGALRWTVTLHHGEHVHPLVPETDGAQLRFTAPPPEDVAAARTTWLEATVVATGADGRTATATRRLDPRRVDLALSTQPSGLTVRVDGQDVATPAVVTSVLCAALQIQAPDQSGVHFSAWSDGGAQQHRVLAGVVPPLTAEFGAGPAPPSAAVPAAPTRVAGAGRFDTAVALSTRRAPCTPGAPLADTAVLARGDAYPDALAGAPLAAFLGGPLLLTQPERLTLSAQEELGRLGVERVVLLGGEQALGPEVAAALRRQGLVVERLNGADRYDTARLVAARLPATDQAYLVQGSATDPARGWPDAVAVGWLAARQGVPILLSAQGRLPAATGDALAGRGVARVTVVGGPSAVSEGVVDEIVALGAAVERVAGAERYATSREVVERAGPVAGSPVFLATGRDFPDALAAGPAVAAEGGVLLLVDGLDPYGSPAATAWLADHRAELSETVLVGGPAALSTEVAAALPGR